jgi:hypothetical protein
MPGLVEERAGFADGVADGGPADTEEAGQHVHRVQVPLVEDGQQDALSIADFLVEDAAAGTGLAGAAAPLVAEALGLGGLQRGELLGELVQAGAALYARLTRAGMLEIMGEDYIRTARAKGLPEREVIIKHGLRAALTPVVTIFGMDLGLLLGGAVITEFTFSLHGLGLFTVLAIQNNDLPEILGVVMLTAFFVVIANLIVDILYAVIDPRVKY